METFRFAKIEVAGRWHKHIYRIPKECKTCKMPFKADRYHARFCGPECLLADIWLKAIRRGIQLRSVYQEMREEGVPVSAELAIFIERNARAHERAIAASTTTGQYVGQGHPFRAPMFLPKKPCKFTDCDRLAASKTGLCKGHYLQSQLGKELKPLRAYRTHNQRTYSSCEALNCDEPVQAYGLCTHHDRHAKQGIPVELKPNV